jgi:hypothetical protein
LVGAAEITNVAQIQPAANGFFGRASASDRPMSGKSRSRGGRGAFFSHISLQLNFYLLMIRQRFVKI